VGWIAGALLGASLLVGLFSWLWGDDSKKFEKAKRDAKKSLFEKTDRMKLKTTGAMKTWFYDNITKGIQRKLKTELKKQLQIWDELVTLLESEAKSLGHIVEIENKLLFAELIAQSTNPSSAGGSLLEAVARHQGSMTKILVKGDRLFASDVDRKRLEDVVGERIIEVLWKDDPVALFCEGIKPAEVSSESVSFDAAARKYTVLVLDGQAGVIFGKKGANLKLTERLLRARIDLQNRHLLRKV
jgi:transcription antitermination factor NusA-like protein/nitrogen fixation-related uncharacterized protein